MIERIIGMIYYKLKKKEKIDFHQSLVTSFVQLNLENYNIHYKKK